MVLIGHVTGACLAYEMAMQLQQAQIEAELGRFRVEGVGFRM